MCLRPSRLSLLLYSLGPLLPEVSSACQTPPITSLLLDRRTCSRSFPERQGLDGLPLTGIRRRNRRLSSLRKTRPPERSFLLRYDREFRGDPCNRRISSVRRQSCQNRERRT